MFLFVIEHSSDNVLRAVRHTDRRMRSWLDEFFGRVGIEHASSGAEAVILKARANPPAIVVIASGSALDLDLLLEKRHLQSRLPAFLQGRFPKFWAEASQRGAQAHSTVRPARPGP